MDPLKKPLVAEDLASKSNLMKVQLESLNKAIYAGEPLKSLNLLCEEAESSLKSFQNFEPKSPFERRDHSRLINEYQKTFENLVSLLESRYENEQSGNQLKFDDLQSDLIKQTAEHTKKIQEKMIVVGELMKDVADTVGEQGKTLDRIDIEVGLANKFTEKAEIQLEKTDLRQRRKKRCCVVFLILAAGFVVGLVVMVIVLAKNH